MSRQVTYTTNEDLVITIHQDDPQHYARVVILDEEVMVHNIAPEDVGAEMVILDQVCCPTDGKQLCYLCRITTDHIRRHTVAKHLPWFLNYETACFFCKVNGGSKSNLRQLCPSVGKREENSQK